MVHNPIKAISMEAGVPYVFNAIYPIISRGRSRVVLVFPSLEFFCEIARATLVKKQSQHQIMEAGRSSHALLVSIRLIGRKLLLCILTAVPFSGSIFVGFFG